MSTVPALTLNTGREIPQLGFGHLPGRGPTSAWRPSDERSTSATATSTPRRCTATRRRSARPCAAAASPARTSSSPASSTTPTTRATTSCAPFDATLQALGVDELDLFLIHWPLPTVEGIDYVETWRALAELHRDGRLRSAGVSNFEVEHLERLAAETDLVPAVDQVEAHPFFANDEVRSYCAEHGIVVEAWSPLAQGDVADDPTVQQVAERVGRTAGQVALRWHLQRGDVVFPEVDHAEPHRGELRRLRLRAGRRRDGRAHRAGPRRGRPPRPAPGDHGLHARLIVGAATGVRGRGRAR